MPSFAPVAAGDTSTLAPKASPVFTGDPTAPTPAGSDNDTSVATTAFVQGLIATEVATRAANDTSVGSANTQTTNYTLVLGDAGKAVEMNSASATTLTVPPNSSVAFPTGTIIELGRIGAGTVTIAQGASVVLRNRIEAAGTTNRTIANQWSSASIRKRATDEWVLVGDIA